MKTVQKLAAVTLAVFCGAVWAKEPTYKVVLDIRSQALPTALMELGEQAGLQVLVRGEDIKRDQGFAPAVSGELTVKAALERILANTGLTYEFLDERTVRIAPIGSDKTGAQVAAVGPMRLSQAETQNQGNKSSSNSSESASGQADEGNSKGIPEILVAGKRSLNMDIPRSRDDVLPFVVFDRQRIQQSGAVNIEDFLKQRLTMNAQQTSFGGSALSTFGNRSQVNLRGLGTNQTLILIDGRRTSNTVSISSLVQQDLNGIPLSAVERIEVLPTTASGIYGGDSTGGVINIILRRDYQGLDATLTFDNSFDSDSLKRRVDIGAGFSLEGGKTNVMLAGSWSDANGLMRQDRDFYQQYRDRAFANYPALWQPPLGPTAFTPPLGYTTNICSGSAFACNGPPLVLDNGTPLNSSITFVPVGYAGAVSDGGAALLANAGRYNFALADNGRFDGGGRYALASSPTVESFNATVRRQFSAHVRAFLEVTASNNVGIANFEQISPNYVLPASAPNNPFQQQIQITVPVVGQQDIDSIVRSTDRRLVGGLIGELPGEWQAELDYIWSRTSNRAVMVNDARAVPAAVIDTELRTSANFNPLRDTNVFRLDFSPYLTIREQGPHETTTKAAAALLGGPVGRLPGGRPVLSVRLEHREEFFGGGNLRDFPPPESGLPLSTFSLHPSKSQIVRSAYAEVRLPLVSAKNELPLLKEFEFHLSGRRDDYEVNGSTASLSAASTDPVVRVKNKLHSINPTLGLRWSPVQDVMARASYGTGFLPPNVTQLAPLATLSSIAGNLLDPRRGNLPIGVTISNARSTGGNPNLRPEESKSWSAGVILTPRWIPRLRVSFDYVRIDRTDRIGGHPQSTQGLINDEAIFPGRILRGTPTAAEAAMGWAGPITFIDQTLFNIALAKTEAYDLQLDYSRETDRWGRFDFYAMATWEPHHQTQTKEGQPVVENSGFSGGDSGGGVLEYKGNAGVTWNRQGWTLGWNTRYFDSYRPYRSTDAANAIADYIRAQGSSRVPDQLYHDVFGTFRFGQDAAVAGSWLSSRLLDRTEFTVGIRNLFNTRPPLDVYQYFPFYSTYGDPRMASYYMTVKKSFAQ